MKILVLNAGRFLSPEGGAVRFKNLVVNRRPCEEVYWIDPAYSRATYDDDEVEKSVAKNVFITKGFKTSSNPLVELWQREKHFLNAAKRFGRECDVAVCYNSWGTFLARRWLKRCGVPLVFDYTDLMHAFRKGIQRVVSRWSVSQALEQADFVFTTAQALSEDAARHNKNVELVPNGVDMNFYSQARQKKLAHPNAGFVGGIGEWVDAESIAETAFALQKTRFYFVGDGPKRGLLEARALPNLEVTGLVPHAEARDWAAGFDACLIPFLQNELTDAVCPIKLFEYWALGKPVVSAPLREVKRITGDAVLYASTPREWRDAVSEVLEDDNVARELSEKGKRVVKDYDWKKLGEKYFSKLEALARK